MKKLAFSLYLMAFSTMASEFFFDSFKTQFAGEIGLFSYGVSWDITEKYEFGLFAGIVPAQIAEETIETYALKNDYTFTTYDFLSGGLSPYVGLAVYHVIGLKYQSSRINAYPRNYYQINALRALFYWGLNYYRLNSKNSFYFEAGMNDYWLQNYVENSEVLDFREYVSLALGWKHKI